MIVRGKYMPGQRVWQAGFHLAISAGSPSVLWQPLVSFAPCVDIQGYCGEVQQFVATLQRLHDPDSLAVALFSQGLCARYIADLDTAYTAFTKCIQLLLQQSPRSSCSPMRQLFSLVVQAELARVQGDCLAAQTYTATALALAGVCSDVYTMAALLIDQGVFLCQQGRLAELSQIYLQIRSLLGRTEAPHIAERCHFFAHHLLANGGIASVPDERPLPLPSAQHTYETLSAREREVLKLVADGLSNQAIATQLVITPGTVKKHLEHIYTRLDVHNRTAAVAKARAMHIVP
jgi:ATP/maltotriose-dependent transcriptional regulator MalT